MTEMAVTTALEGRRRRVYSSGGQSERGEVPVQLSYGAQHACER